MDGGSTPPKSTILCLTNRQFKMEQKTNRSKMSTEELSEALKAKGIPMSSEFATTLVQHGYIVKAGLTFQDGYSWSNTEPIHMNKVAELVAITRKRVAAQARKYYHKKEAVRQGTWVEQPKETTEIEQVLEEVPVHEHKELVPVDKAIKLLTENGYRVSKPVLIYEEVTVK